MTETCTANEGLANRNGQNPGTGHALVGSKRARQNTATVEKGRNMVAQSKSRQIWKMFRDAR